MPLATRNDARAGMSDPVRIVLLEQDADQADRRMDVFDERLGKMLWILVGILISTTTASILLAVNLVVKG